MNEKCLEVLESYNLDVEKVTKGRGAYIVKAGNGLFKLLPYQGTESRLNMEYELLNNIKSMGLINVDELIRDREGKLWVEDSYGVKYILKKWYEGRECDVKNIKDIMSAVENLALLHLCTYCADLEKMKKNIPVCENLNNRFVRHNRQLKRVRNYIRTRKRKSQFEYDVLANFNEFFSYAVEAEKNSDENTFKNRCKDGICHGSYTYHNIIICQPDGIGNKLQTAVVNFEKVCIGPRVNDLYLFLRKVMEKHNWNNSLGIEIIEKYAAIRPFDEDELEMLFVMLSYPEKYYKILNQYISGNKSWIPDKNVAKLNMVYEQQKLKRDFIENAKNSLCVALHKKKINI